MLMECEAIFIFLYTWLHQNQITVVNYLKDHSNREIARRFRFWIINLNYIAFAKLFTYLEDRKMDKFCALKRLIALAMVISCDICTSCHTFTYTFFKPATNLTKIEAQTERELQIPSKNQWRSLLFINQIFYTEERLENIETIFKPDSIIISILQLLLLREHKQLYSKPNDAAGGEEQHFLQPCLSLKAKLVFPAQCLGLSGPKLSACLKQLERSH